MSPTKSSRGVPKQIDKNALLVAQEITFAKILSGNDPKIRERGIKRLQKWLTARSSSTCQLKENDVKRIWKGLFYCMWMSDKPLTQEEVADNISNLVHCLRNTKAFICFVKCFFSTLAVEWRGLDQWRIDKFLMFVRRFLRQVFLYCDQQSWSLKLVKELGVVFNCSILPDHKALTEISHPPIGFSLHFIDVYMDELTKVSKGHLQNNELLVALLRPFAVYMSEAPERIVATQIVSQIFDRLIEQSKEGHKFREKFEAWKQLGFPRGTIDAVERVHTGDSDEEIGDYEEEENALDPRAGGVNVELPVAHFNPEAVVNLLREYRHSKTSNSWSRKIVNRVMGRFGAIVQGKYPLGIKKVDKIPKINFAKLAKQSAEELFEFRDRIMYEDDDEWIESIRGKKKDKNKSALKKSTKSAEDDIDELHDEEFEHSDDDAEVDDSEDNAEVDDNEDGAEVDDSEDDAEVDDSEDDAEVDDSEDDAEVDNSEDDAEVDNSEDDAEVHESQDDAEADDSEDDAEVDDSEDDAEVDDSEDDAEVDDSEDDAEVDSENDAEVDDSEDDVVLDGGDDDAEMDLKSGDVNDELESDGDAKERVLVNMEKNVVQKKPPQKNLPRIIPIKSSENRKRPQQEETLQTKSPQFISNGTKKQLCSKKDKKEETVIIVRKKRKLAEALSTPVIQRGKQFKKMRSCPTTPQTPGSAKKVQFILQRNTAQATSEYDKILRENPGNPYDSAKKPRFSVLKSTPFASPVNPFYMR